ncbi:hypothetical protein L2D14_07515 [Thalassospiraceae bacterium LMO-JJ14]|nr:hypothetical protein L2D14_07515 [Thalassospiraceae bacterium LMO-JJ14]
MKHKTKLLATLGVVAGLAVAGYAVTAHANGGSHRCEGGQGERQHGMMGGGSHGMMGGGMRMMHMMETYDTNNDGALTVEEVTAERAKKFKAFDKNADGMLDLNEYQALWMDAMRERMVDRFQKHDNDGDGKISEQDFSERYSRMMTWMDRNEDGKIDREDHMGSRRHHGNN